MYAALKATVLLSILQKEHNVSSSPKVRIESRVPHFNKPKQLNHEEVHPPSLPSLLPEHLFAGSIPDRRLWFLVRGEPEIRCLSICPFRQKRSKEICTDFLLRSCVNEITILWSSVEQSWLQLKISVRLTQEMNNI